MPIEPLDETGLDLGAFQSETQSRSPQSSLSRSPSPLRMNLRSARYYSIKDVRAGALDRDSGTDEGDVSTESNSDSGPDFNESDADEFDPILGGDYDMADDNMDID
jgi:hypothetical protein